MRFGGESQFGQASFGGVPYGVAPGYVCDRMIEALERFRLKDDGTGCVRTIKRVSEDTIRSIDQQALGGLPGFFVAYRGGPYKPVASNGRVHQQTATYAVLCASADYKGYTQRLEGRNVYFPGSDNLMRWAVYHVGKELLAIKGLGSQRPAAERYIAFEAGKYVGLVEFEVTARIDLYDEAVFDTLQRIGAVHNPNDLEQLFEADNTTPNSDDPVGGGVMELEE